MAVTVFHAGAGQYGLLMSMMAIGTITGALLAAGRETPSFTYLVIGAGMFGIGCALAAVMPSYWLFGCALVIIGVSTMTFSNSSNSLMQLSTAPAMRGRVMAMRLAIALGGTPVGAPIVGWVADRFGPRWAVGIGAAAGVAAALVGLWYLYRQSRRADRLRARTSVAGV
jgi:MFS family permease